MNKPHTAIDTWSGFVYQGKIALYHVLQLLNQNKISYDLQLDSIEDFAIINPIDNQTKSLHQVKAVNNKYYQRYLTDFIKLKNKKDLYGGNAYFHLAVQNEKTASQINTIHPDIEIYKYDNNHYCGLDEINSFIEELISKYLESNKLSSNNNSNNLEVLRCLLEKIIFDKVILIHSSNHSGIPIAEGAYKQTIPLFNFKNVLQKDPSLLLDDNYYLFKTKELLNQYFIEFCFEKEEFDSELDDLLKFKLESYLIEINSLNPNDILFFLQTLLPTREIKLTCLKSFKDNNIQQNEFKDAFIQSLFELTKSNTTIKEGLTWIDANLKRYTVSAINSGKKSTNIVCNRILKNIKEINLDIPFNCQTIITSDIDVDSIEKEVGKINDIEENNIIIEKNYTKITAWGKISLISIDNAKSIFNEK